MILLIFLRYKRLYQQLIQLLQTWEKPIQGKAACAEINAAYGLPAHHNICPIFSKSPRHDDAHPADQPQIKKYGK